MSAADHADNADKKGGAPIATINGAPPQHGTHTQKGTHYDFGRRGFGESNTQVARNSHMGVLAQMLARACGWRAACSRGTLNAANMGCGG